MRRGGGRIMVAAVAMLALGTGAPVAGAADRSATPGWRVVKVYTQCGDASLNAITTTGASDAWVTGDQLCHLSDRCTCLLIARWDGHSWQTLRPPARLKLQPPARLGIYQGTAVAALSSSYAWTFAVDPYHEFRGAALLWQNGRWHALRMPQIQSAAAFSRSDAWAFPPFNSTAAEPAASFAERWNGHAWHTVPMPVATQATATVGPRSIWAVGPLPTTTQQPEPSYALAHWTGRWRTISFPHLNLPPGDDIFNTWVVADKSVGAWVLAEAGEYTPAAYLLHWTGHRWRVVKVPYMSSGFPDNIGPLARDGNGGVWMATYPPDSGLAMVHYSSAGTWQRKFVPIVAKIESMRLIPGTRSVWAASASSYPTILKYGR